MFYGFSYICVLPYLVVGKIQGVLQLVVSTVDHELAAVQLLLAVPVAGLGHGIDTVCPTRVFVHRRSSHASTPGQEGAAVVVVPLLLTGVGGEPEAVAPPTEDNVGTGMSEQSIRLQGCVRTSMFE